MVIPVCFPLVVYCYLSSSKLDVIRIFLRVSFCLFRATTAAYGGSQARGLMGAVAAGLHHSHSNARSEPHLRPTLQLTAMPDP